MEVKTRFDIGDKVWFIGYNKARCGYISGIKVISSVGCNIDIYYLISDCGREYNESNLSASKEELINKLLDE